MTDRMRINGSAQPEEQYGKPEPIPARGEAHRRFNNPKILQPGDSQIGTAEAARRARISPRQMRDWVPLHQIGRKIGGRQHVDPRLLDMYRAGDTGAQDDYLHGDRTSNRVRGYMDGSDT